PLAERVPRSVLSDFYSADQLAVLGDATEVDVLWVGGVPMLRGEGRMTPTQDQRPFVPSPSAEIPMVPSTVRNLGKIARSVYRNEHILLVGGTGVGKTSIVFELYRRLGRPVFYVNFHNGVNVDELVGGWHPTSMAGKYEYIQGLLAQAMRAGAPIYIDELNL